jgi:hypothetical protein
MRSLPTLLLALAFLLLLALAIRLDSSPPNDPLQVTLNGWMQAALEATSPAKLKPSVLQGLP